MVPWFLRGRTVLFSFRCHWCISWSTVVVLYPGEYPRREVCCWELWPIMYLGRACRWRGPVLPLSFSAGIFSTPHLFFYARAPPFRIFYSVPPLFVFWGPWGCQPTCRFAFGSIDTDEWQGFNLRLRYLKGVTVGDYVCPHFHLDQVILRYRDGTLWRHTKVIFLILLFHIPAKTTLPLSQSFLSFHSTPYNHFPWKLIYDDMGNSFKRVSGIIIWQKEKF